MAWISQLNLIQNQSLLSFISFLEGDYFFTQVLLGHFYFHTYHHCRINCELRNSKKAPRSRNRAHLNCCRGHGFITLSLFLPLAIPMHFWKVWMSWQAERPSHTHWSRLDIQNRCCRTYQQWQKCQGGKSHHRTAEGGRSFLRWSFPPWRPWRGGQEVREHFHPEEDDGIEGRLDINRIKAY